MNGYDISKEAKNYVCPGIQHKYDETMMVISSVKCHKICEWCFRKRIFAKQNLVDDVVADPFVLGNYLESHPEVRSVLLSGGDILLADQQKVRKFIVATLHSNVVSIRLATRAIILDPVQYFGILSWYTYLINFHKKKPIVAVQAVHPDEISMDVRLARNGIDAQFLLQTPLLKGINDDPDVLKNLWEKALKCGIEPYYVFQNRPVEGNKQFSVPLEKGVEIFEKAKASFSGIEKRVTYVMSHDLGKIEIVGTMFQRIENPHNCEVICKFHQARNKNDLGRIFLLPGEEIWWRK